MIVHKGKRFISSPFNSEEEIEKAVEANSEYIFGPDSIYLPKKLIKSAEGAGTVPDGFALDLSNKQWYIIEAEVSTHSVWSHIAPQVTKQILAATQPQTRNMLIELIVEQTKADNALQERFEDLGVAEIDIRKVLTEIFETPPMVGMPIDAVGPDLREWAQTLKTEVKLWIIRKLVEFGDSSNVLYELPDEYKPVLDTARSETEEKLGIAIYDVSLSDLMKEKYLADGESLFFTYKPRGGKSKDFEAILGGDGTLTVLGKEFSSPSYAAVYCMQTVGSKRNTINGWIYWRTKKGEYISELRDQYLGKLQRQKIS